MAQWYAERQFATALMHAAEPASQGAVLPSGLPVPPSALGTESLARVCIYALGRAATALSAAGLSRALPQDLSIACGEAKVREVLRSYPCFYPLPRGRWQLGRPWGRVRLLPPN